MSKGTRIERARVELTSSLQASKSPALSSDSPFRILVLGDFSGRESREAREPADLGNDRVPIPVDRDNLDALPERLGVAARIQLVEGGPLLDVPIRRLDDFHPDRLFERMAGFRFLHRTRRELQDPETFERAAREVRAWENPAADRGAEGHPEDPNRAPAQSEPAESESESQQLVAEMLERSQVDASSAPGADFDRFVEAIVRPHLVAAEAPEQADLLARTDAAIGSWMRELLHHPRFQALEAAWRGVDFLVRRLDTDRAVRIDILDIGREELARDLRSVADLTQSALHKLLVQEGEGDDETAARGGGPWSLIVGLYTFGRELEEIVLLGRLSKIARDAGSPFLAAASPGLDPAARAGESREEAQAESDAALWAALRELPEAAWIGLALPRFLLRLPYGAQTDPVEGFPFEEIADDAAHDNLLWGNSALACACLIAQAWESEGPSFRPGAVREIDGLPLYVAAARSGSEGERQARPAACAETTLSDRDAAAILDEGLIAVLSVSGRDAIQVPRFQSIANPPRPLAGIWDEGAG